MSMEHMADLSAGFVNGYLQAMQLAIQEKRWQQDRQDRREERLYQQNYHDQMLAMQKKGQDSDIAWRQKQYERTIDRDKAQDQYREEQLGLAKQRIDATEKYNQNKLNLDRIKTAASNTLSWLRQSNTNIHNQNMEQLAAERNEIARANSLKETTIRDDDGTNIKIVYDPVTGAQRRIGEAPVNQPTTSSTNPPKALTDYIKSRFSTDKHYWTAPAGKDIGSSLQEDVNSILRTAIESGASERDFNQSVEQVRGIYQRQTGKVIFSDSIKNPISLSLKEQNEFRAQNPALYHQFTDAMAKLDDIQDNTQRLRGKQFLVEELRKELKGPNTGTVKDEPKLNFKVPGLSDAMIPNNPARKSGGPMGSRGTPTTIDEWNKAKSIPLR